MVLRYITIEEFLNGQSGIKVEIGEGKCFRSEQKLIDFLSAIEEMLDNYMCRRLDYGTYTDQFWGGDSQVRQPKVYPVESITEISYTYVGNNDPTIIDSSAYIFSKTLVSYPSIFNNKYLYSMTYVAGFQDIPYVIKQAVIEQAGLNLMQHMKTILESESGNNTKIVYEPVPLPLWPHIEQKVRAYRRPNLFL